ncbi:hypothetical protein RB195_011026 [Necator americanus]|uniref:Uncharacterized protein n=1 Tax=Necator americanus TaxID=51031 RepID=A0ABR1D1U6_NECAM
MDANDPSLTNTQNYASYACRFMLVAMRSRKSSVLPPADREPSETPIRTELQKATIPSRGGKNEECWVEVYSKENNAVRDGTSDLVNFFVIYHVSLELVALYDVLRVA